MKFLKYVFLLAALFYLVGCQTRSISDSGYNSSPFYKGELSELAVLGVETQPDDAITESDIQAALQRDTSISMERGQKIVLVQSGAVFPDQTMMAEADKRFNVVPLSGVPSEEVYTRRNRQPDVDLPQPPLNKELRLAAANTGARTLIVYWGFLESSRDVKATAFVSWVPIVGSVIPDQTQDMRIRLKAAIIDVATGQWELMTPEVYGDEALSAGINREKKDQKQVALLKEQAYQRLMQDIETRYFR